MKLFMSYRQMNMKMHLTLSALSLFASSWSAPSAQAEWKIEKEGNGTKTFTPDATLSSSGPWAMPRPATYPAHMAWTIFDPSGGTGTDANGPTAKAETSGSITFVGTWTSSTGQAPPRKVWLIITSSANAGGRYLPGESSVASGDVDNGFGDEKKESKQNAWDVPNWMVINWRSQGTHVEGPIDSSSGKFRFTLDGLKASATGTPSSNAGVGVSVGVNASADEFGGVKIVSSIEDSYIKRGGSGPLQPGESFTDRIKCERSSDDSITVHSAVGWVYNEFVKCGWVAQTPLDAVLRKAPSSLTYEWEYTGDGSGFEGGPILGIWHPVNYGGYMAPGDDGPHRDMIAVMGEQGSGFPKSSTIKVQVREPARYGMSYLIPELSNSYTIKWHLPFEVTKDELILPAPNTRPDVKEFCACSIL